MALQLLLHGVQIVGALGLACPAARSSAWVRMFSILASSSVPYFCGLGQGLAGDVGVDVDLEGLVVLADDQAVADAVQIRPEGLDGHVRPSCAR